LESETIQFAVLLRKGAKQTLKEIAVPKDSDMALNLHKQEEAHKLEKERMKKLTLEINERQEEEEVNEAIAMVTDFYPPCHFLLRGRVYLLLCCSSCSWGEFAQNTAFLTNFIMLSAIAPLHDPCPAALSGRIVNVLICKLLSGVGR
jgi:hypothetical protein